ncbi:hypothetical protein GOP47_0017919 [Adiantum capillus-veneris]|uniref:F-box domain-containing protein n=1 Tax=Adiantum capillus-veneris TaxID=13818 RepID=A0A9D4ZC94_ADICA|nr:hypothetical protein GOP47_0017919 [Adiantum capillus-veneris]
MEEAASSSSSSGAASASASFAAAATSSSSSVEAAGAARQLLMEARDDGLHELLREARDDGLHAHSRQLQIRALRDIRAASMQHLNMLQQPPDAMQEAADFADQFFEAPSSSQIAEVNTVLEAQNSEVPSWFEDSVDYLLRSMHPSPLSGRGRASLEDATGNGHPSSGQVLDTSLNYKRPKVLGFSTHGLKACSRGGQNTSCQASHLGLIPAKGQHRGPVASVQSSMRDRNHVQQDDSQSGTTVALGCDVPSMYVIEDLLHTVFSRLDQRSLCQAARVCRQWRTASEYEDFWKSLHFGSKVTQEQVVSVCRRFPRAVDLSFTHVSLVDDLATQAMHSLRHLEKLSIYKGSLGDNFFNVLAMGCPALHCLNIHDVILGNLGSQEVQIRHKNLGVLRVTECRVMRIGIRCPLLEKLYLRQTNMASATLNCSRLLSLDVSSCMKLSDAGVRLAAMNCRGLLALNISQCSYISDETLREICSTCTNLQGLDASVCPNISLQGVRMPALKVLKLNNCEGINSSSMAALSQCIMLEAITLDACVLLTAVTLNLQRLQSISLANCNKLVELTLQCPALVDLDVADCTALARLDISSLALRRLFLQKQISLITLALDCPYLLVVNLLECDSLANSICEVLSDGGGCPRLNSLTLESCESLSVLSLSSTTLGTLSFAGCQNLVQIELACPNLQQLLLDGCRQLSFVSLAPVGLQSLNLGICPHVTSLNVEASAMTSVDLKGCGDLRKADIVCPQLLSLDASYCSSLNDECLETATMACPLIQSLVLACCPLVGPDGLLTLKKLGSLTTLDLSYTFLRDLGPIFESCKRLKVLRLLACKYLEDSPLDALQYNGTLPELRELDLSYGGLGHDALNGVLTRCTYLTHVNFNGCANLGDLVWEVNNPENAHEVQSWQHQFQLYDDSPENSNTAVAGCSSHSFNFQSSENLEMQDQKMVFPHALQQLSCVGCPNMRRVKVLDAVGFHDLSCLNLSLSRNLKEVYLECPSLTTLNLSHCTALESLQLRCPRLVSLSLQASSIAASGLEAVLQGCTALGTLDLRNCVKILPEDLIDIRAACPRLRRLLSSASMQTMSYSWWCCIRQPATYLFLVVVYQVLDMA